MTCGTGSRRMPVVVGSFDFTPSFRAFLRVFYFFFLLFVKLSCFWLERLKESRSQIREYEVRMNNIYCQIMSSWGRTIICWGRGGGVLRSQIIVVCLMYTEFQQEGRRNMNARVLFPSITPIDCELQSSSVNQHYPQYLSALSHTLRQPM